MTINEHENKMDEGYQVRLFDSELKHKPTFLSTTFFWFFSTDFSFANIPNNQLILNDFLAFVQVEKISLRLVEKNVGFL